MINSKGESRETRDREEIPAPLNVELKMMKMNKLGTYDLFHLLPMMEKLEKEAGRPYQHISGGFARAEIYDVTKNNVYIRLEYGVESDAEEVIHVEKYIYSKSTKQIYPQ